MVQNIAMHLKITIMSLFTLYHILPKPLITKGEHLKTDFNAFFVVITINVTWSSGFKIDTKSTIKYHKNGPHN